MAPRKKVTEPVAPQAEEVLPHEEVRPLSQEETSSISITDEDIINGFKVISAAMERAKDSLELEELVKATTIYANMKGFVDCLENDKAFNFDMNDVENFVVLLSVLTSRKPIFSLQEYVVVGTVFTKFNTVLSLTREVERLQRGEQPQQ